MSILICEMVIKMDKRKCLGCLHNRRVPLNHMCEQASLLEKFEKHFDIVLIRLMENLKTIVNRFTTLSPSHVNQSELCYSTAHNFLAFSTARSIYYGAYCEDEELYKTIIDSVQDLPINKVVSEVNSPKRAAEKSKPTVSLKRQRKSAASAQQHTIDKVLSDAYDEAYGPQ